MIETVVKTGCLAIAGALCALTLRKYVPELSLVLAVVTAGAVAMMIMGAAEQVRDAAATLISFGQLDENLISPVVKVTLIAILSRVIGQICRDAGEGTIALCCEVAATCAALGVTVPLMRRVLELIGGLLA